MLKRITRRINVIAICALIAGGGLCFLCHKEENRASQLTNESGTFWASGYLPGWRHTMLEIPFMTAEDYQFLTHIIHFGGMPKPDGSIDLIHLNLEPANRKLAVESAHAARKPILFCVVGEYPVFNPVIRNPNTRRAFIGNLISIMMESGYDGIDLHMKPVCAPFGSFGYKGVDLTRKPELVKKFPVNNAYISLVKELRAELDKRLTPWGERPLLTAAMHWRDCHIFGKKEVHSRLDQINLMTYDMSDPQTCGVTWFDSPLYNGGYNFPRYNMPAYSIEMFIDDCLAAGIPAKKLGLGICLDALVWQGGGGVTATEGVTAPRQMWTKAPSHPREGAPRFSYAEMMKTIYGHGIICWDETAQAPYLSIDEPGSAGDMFVSYNDERSIKAKIEYMKKRKLGGFFIWELSADYRPDLPAANQRPLRQAMQEALLTQK